MVLAWNSVFLDKRDSYILGVLPIRMRTIFVAKLSAIGVALAVTVIAINFFSGLALPLLIAAEGHAPLRVFLSYWTAVTAAGLFTAAMLLAIQGVASACLPHHWFLRLSGLIQVTTFFAIASVYLLRPDADSVASSGSIAGLVPTFWFYGLFEWMVGKGFQPLAGSAVAALVLATAIAAGAFARAYRRSLRGIVEQPDITPGRGWQFAGRMISTVLARLCRDPMGRAITEFAGRTIARSRQHRLLLAVYGGTGFGLALYFLRDLLRGTYSTARVVGGRDAGVSSAMGPAVHSPACRRVHRDGVRDYRASGSIRFSGVVTRQLDLSNCFGGRGCRLFRGSSASPVPARRRSCLVCGRHPVLLPLARGRRDPSAMFPGCGERSAG